MIIDTICDKDMQVGFHHSLQAKQDMKRLTGEVSSLQRSLSDLRRDLSVLEVKIMKYIRSTDDIVTVYMMVQDELRRSDSERKKIAGILDDIRGALTKVFLTIYTAVQRKLYKI